MSDALFENRSKTTFRSRGQHVATRVWVVRVRRYRGAVDYCRVNNSPVSSNKVVPFFCARRTRKHFVPEVGAVMVFDWLAIEPSGTPTIRDPVAPVPPVAVSAWTSQVTFTVVSANVSLKMRRFVVRVAPLAIVGAEAGQSPLAFGHLVGFPVPLVRDEHGTEALLDARDDRARPRIGQVVVFELPRFRSDGPRKANARPRKEAVAARGPSCSEFRERQVISLAPQPRDLLRECDFTALDDPPSISPLRTTFNYHSTG